MPRLLQIAHDHLSPPNAVADQFVERGFDITELFVVPQERFDTPGVHVTFPDPTAYDAVMLLGAPWSTYDPEVASWVEPEIEMLRHADRAGVPVLGICFGGQLLATAHGGRVHRTPRPGDRLAPRARRRLRAGRRVVPVALRPLGEPAERRRGGPQRRRLPGVRATPQPGAAVPPRGRRGQHQGLAGARRTRNGGRRRSGLRGHSRPHRGAGNRKRHGRARALVDTFLDRVAVAARRELQS